MRKTLACLGMLAAGFFAEAADLTFEERVAAQRAIEQVYWNHRVWPEQNPGPKPPLAAILSEEALRARVADYLQKSNALESIWRRPITSGQLQAEMERMARDTKAPELLRELFAALGNDPLRIAETLARPKLVNRLLENWYAFDDHFHGETERRARRALVGLRGYAELGDLAGADYSASTWQLSNPDHAKILERQRAELAGKRLSGLRETADAFVATILVSEDRDQVTTATIVWRKTPLESWWAQERVRHATDLTEVPGTYRSVALGEGSCVEDTWRRPAAGSTVLDWRSHHTAVWTGSEMIVWGGRDGSIGFNSGGRYDPATDTWTATSTAGSVPSPRTEHSAVWTGTHMIIWGGDTQNTGGRYDPVTDTWTPTSTGSGNPSARSGHTAVWTGTEMIVWGGWASGNPNPPYNFYFSTGARYNPGTDTWTAIPTFLSHRTGHAAVWTGSKMVVWGGHYIDQAFDEFWYNDGGRYDPVTNAWSSVATSSAPPGRRSHTALWSGSRMIVWGGTAGGTGLPFTTGANYDPLSDTWTQVSTSNAPSMRHAHTAVWTGTRMIVWGGWLGSSILLSTGAAYNPANDTWTATATGGACPAPRSDHSAVWTGSEMIVWGGVEGAAGGKVATNTGGRYNPLINSWTATEAGVHSPRNDTGHTTIWTGTEAFVWGGAHGVVRLNSGARYDVSTDTWSPTSTTGSAPVQREEHSAVWSGTEMIVWGGRQAVNSGYLSSGARYNPTTDAWITTPTNAGVPSARALHSAVWTGRAMIVWGGQDASSAKNTGALFDPVENEWRPTSIGADVPSARTAHSAVWTGNRMIVWGNSSDPGGRYDPNTDAWEPVTTTGSPSRRLAHSALWTGSAMIVWGGDSGSTLFGDGARYNPTSNTWTAVTTTGSVSPRRDHSAIWTGAEMIVWGGDDGAEVDTGGRYSPASDSWVAMAPGGSLVAGRRRHRAIWTGREMLVVGGVSPSVGDGLYCACSGATRLYRDADADGFGDPGVSSACAGLVGYVADNSDCDDSSAGVFPGAPQVCDGVNNDCSNPAWPQGPPGDADADDDSIPVCGGDCDDANASVYPGAPEICDAVNNDCDDPAWPALPASDRDADGDGYRECAGDCDDTNPAFHPGAADPCNAVDENCDELDGTGGDPDIDKVASSCDNCPLRWNADQSDVDADGRGDLCDNCPSNANPGQEDGDIDTWADACDNCPALYNPGQDDFENDRVGDACDNCDFDANPSQQDVDDDGEGDRCDLNDGRVLIIFHEPSYLEWLEETGFDGWNAYRGDMDVLRQTGTYTQAPGSNALARRDCGVQQTWVEDFDAPGAGQVALYLVTGLTGGVEGGLGENGAGTERPNANPCP